MPRLFRRPHVPRPRPVRRCPWSSTTRSPRPVPRPPALRAPPRSGRRPRTGPRSGRLRTGGLRAGRLRAGRLRTVRLRTVAPGPVRAAAWARRCPSCRPPQACRAQPGPVPVLPVQLPGPTSSVLRPARTVGPAQLRRIPRRTGTGDARRTRRCSVPPPGTRDALIRPRAVPGPALRVPAASAPAGSGPGAAAPPLRPRSSSPVPPRQVSRAPQAPQLPQAARVLQAVQARQALQARQVPRAPQEPREPRAPRP